VNKQNFDTFCCNVTFIENRTVYEIMWKNKMTIWRMLNACWIPKAKDTHSEYVVLFAFPLQQWLHERNSILRYEYIVRRVKGYNTTIFK